MTPLGLYLHVPFCTRRCDYCDFFVVVGREDLFERFVVSLLGEIASAGRKAGVSGFVTDTVYIGGGTPSLLDPSQIARMMGSCRRAFDMAPDAEVTLEANPEGVSDDRLDGWLEAGVNRLSLGVQSTADATLKSRGRLHTGRQALEAVGRARSAGFANIGVDFIAGLPQGEPRTGGMAAEVEEGIREAVALRPEHVSLYLLETDKDSPMMQAARDGRLHLPPDDEAADAFIASREILLTAGYRHYEISNFCLDGRRSRHNLKYWTGLPFLGLGPSAHSYFRGRLTAHRGDLEAFLAGGSEIVDHTPREKEAADREALVMNLRLLDGVDLEAFDALRGTRFLGELRGRLADLHDAGWVQWEGSTLRLTAGGVLVANEVFARVTDPPRSHP